jgi:hypothetical protein
MQNEKHSQLRQSSHRFVIFGFHQSWLYQQRTQKCDTSAKKLSWKGAYSGLSGPATAAHFHGPAPKGQNAGVVVPVGAAKSPVRGSATLTDAQPADLTKGNWYFNVHTAENKGGEIRGQVSPVK